MHCRILRRSGLARALAGQDSELPPFAAMPDYVAETAGRSIGSGGWSRDQRDAALAHVRAYVHPEYLRKGVGRRLVALAEERAKQAGCNAFAADSSLNAVANYAAHRYREVTEQILTKKGDVAFPVFRMEEPDSGKP